MAWSTLCRLRIFTSEHCIAGLPAFPAVAVCDERGQPPRESRHNHDRNGASKASASPAQTRAVSSIVAIGHAEASMDLWPQAIQASLKLVNGGVYRSFSLAAPSRDRHSSRAPTRSRSSAFARLST